MFTIYVLYHGKHKQYEFSIGLSVWAFYNYKSNSEDKPLFIAIYDPNGLILAYEYYGGA